jgi:hypothetical protein
VIVSSANTPVTRGGGSQGGTTQSSLPAPGPGPSDLLYLDESDPAHPAYHPAPPPPASPPGELDGDPESGGSMTLRMLNPTPAVEMSTTGERLLGVFTFDTGVLEDYSYSIDWGDGYFDGPIQATEGDCGEGEVRGEHTYEYWGAYTITVTVEGPGDSRTGNVGMLVTDAPLSAVGLNSNFTEGVPASVAVATVTDSAGPYRPAPESTTTVWGNGNAGPLTPPQAPPPLTTNGTIYGETAYTREGPFPVTTRVVDTGGAHAFAYGTATVGVNNMDVMAGEHYAQAGVGFTRDIGHAAKIIGSLAPKWEDSGDFTASINWGDGSSSAATLLGFDYFGAARFVIIGSHTYAQPGDYHHTVTVEQVAPVYHSWTSPAGVFHVSAGPPPSNGTLYQPQQPLATDRTPHLQTSPLTFTEGENRGPTTAATFTVADPAATAGQFSVPTMISWGTPPPQGTRPA